MKIYHYHPETGTFLGYEEAFESPKEPGKPLVPAYATTKAPPETEGDDYPAFIDGKWVVITPPEPEPEHVLTEAEKAAIRIAQIDTELAMVDTSGARPSREVALALLAGKTPDPAAVEKLQALEAQAVNLRAEHAALVAA